MRAKTAGYPFTIIRLGPNHHASDAAVEEWLRVVRKHRAACDEVWFLTELGFPAIDVHKRSAELMARAAEKVRKAGILPAVELYDTLGHADLPMFASDGITWQKMVGPDGTIAGMSNCPRAKGLHEYLRKIMRLYVAFKPSSVWINDDLRMHHHRPVDFGCFCNDCIAEFNDYVEEFTRQEDRKDWTRETLAAALHEEHNGRLRLLWTRFGAQSLAIVARVVAEAVHEVSPESRIGLEHCGPEWGLYSGPDWAPTFKALAEVSGQALGSRPGGGYYTDHRPREVLDKALSIAHQVARLPKEVKVVCPEIENFPHTIMGKTPHGLVVESALDLAYGCNCLSYAILSIGHETSEAVAPQLQRIAKWRTFLQKYVAENEGTKPGGIGVVFGMNHAGRKVHPDEKPFAWAGMSFGDLYQLPTMGLPLCADKQAPCAAVLTANAMDGLTQGELKGVLAGGVLMDGPAMMRLQERGLGELGGVRAVRRQVESYERFTCDPLNGSGAGETWMHVSFGSSADVVLEPIVPDVRVLGVYVGDDGKADGAATTVYENALGGRVAVFGYRGLENVVTTARRAQMLALADWVSKGKLPVIIDTPAQVVPVPRVDAEGRLKSVLLLNATIDSSPALFVRLRKPAVKTVRWIQPLRKDRKLAVKSGKGEIVVNVPPMSPWSVGYILLSR